LNQAGSQGERVTVNIFGQEYVVKGASPEHIKRLALHVDKVMRQISQRFPHYSPVKVAVLAALNIADELYKIQEDYEALIRLIQEERGR